jgi:hypothetical protein
LTLFFAVGNLLVRVAFNFVSSFIIIALSFFITILFVLVLLLVVFLVFFFIVLIHRDRPFITVWGNILAFLGIIESFNVALKTDSQ